MTTGSAELQTTVDQAPGFADLARLLHSAPTPQATLELICRAAVFVLPGAEHASITVAVATGSLPPPAAIPPPEPLTGPSSS